MINVKKWNIFIKPNSAKYSPSGEKDVIQMDERTMLDKLLWWTETVIQLINIRQSAKCKMTLTKYQIIESTEAGWCQVKNTTYLAAFT